MKPLIACLHEGRFCVITYCFILGVVLGMGCNSSTQTDNETTLIEAQNMLKKAGGEDKVKKEAKQVFARFGTEKTRFIVDSELKEFPAIAALGNSVDIHAPSPGFPANISIRYGTHERTKF